MKMTKLPKFACILICVLMSTSIFFVTSSHIASAQAPKTVYVVMNVDTEMYVPSYSDPWVGSTNPHPTADMRIFSSTTPSTVAAVFNADFRNANRDSDGNPFKITWFCQMDYVMDQSNFVWADGSPAGVSGYTAVYDLLTNTWGTEITSYGDSIGYHHHFLTYDGTWERHDSGPDEIYPGYQEDALDHMILDRNFYPSAFRAGYWIMPPALSSWLDDWLPFDYTPLYGLPWYPTNSTGGRWQVATRYGATQADVELSFAQAESSGKAVYSDVVHSWEDMASEIAKLQGYLETVRAEYPYIDFKYVTAQEAVQQFLPNDLTAPTLTITPAGSSYTITSSEPLWQNNPYVALKYADGTYRHATAVSAGTNMWTVTPPTQDVTEEQVAVGTATATSSSNEDGHPPEQAIDGIESAANYWGTDSTVNPLPQSINVDLQSSYSINGITTHFWDGDSRTYTYHIEVSGDGASWTTVVPSKQGSGVVTDTFAETSARYVRITVTGNTANTGAQIEEIRIYHKTTTPISSSVTEIGVGASDLSGNTNTQTMNVPQRSLTVASAHGSPSPTVGVHSYADGDSVTASVLSPVTEGSLVWTCTGWTGTGSVPATGSAATVTFTISADSSITWTWSSAPVTWQITVTQNDHGTISPGTDSYAQGSSPSETVTPDSGYYIASITVDSSSVPVTTSSGQTVDFNDISADHSITATYAQITWTITVTQSAHGTISPDTASYAPGSGPSETITPDSGYYIASITVDGNPVTVTTSSGQTVSFDDIQMAHTITAAFAQIVYQITVDSGGHGAPSQGSQWVPAGSDFTVSVTNPDVVTAGQDQWNLTGLSLDSVPQTLANSLTISDVEGAHTIVFSWTEQYYITVDNGGHGVPTEASQWVNKGSSFSTSVVSPADVVSGVSQWVTSQSVLGIDSVQAAQTLTFSWTEQFYLTVDDGGHGVAGGAGWYDSGTSAYASMSPLTVAGTNGVQYVFAGWTGDASGSGSPSDAILMDGPKTATATWKTLYSVYLLLNSESQPPYTRGRQVTFEVSVMNQLNPQLETTLTFTITGPGGYCFYDFQSINVPANGVGEFSFSWVVPDVAGTYVVEVSLVPAQLTAYDAKWVEAGELPAGAGSSRAESLVVSNSLLNAVYALSVLVLSGVCSLLLFRFKGKNLRAFLRTLQHSNVYVLNA